MKANLPEKPGDGAINPVYERTRIAKRQTMTAPAAPRIIGMRRSLRRSGSTGGMHLSGTGVPSAFRSPQNSAIAAAAKRSMAAIM